MDFFNYVPGVGPVKVSLEQPFPKDLKSPEMDERQKFWKNQNWPRDALGKVFLGRAVHELGRAMFGDEWTGHEPTVDSYTQPLPLMSVMARPADIATAASQYGFEPKRDAVGRKYVSDADWDAARGYRSSYLNTIQPIRKRLADVQNALVDAMLSGTLPYCLRIDETGLFTDPLPQHYWNTEKTWARFYFCAMSEKKPITDIISGDGFRRIFVDGAALEKLCRQSSKDDEKNTLAHQWALEGYLRDAVSKSPNERTLLYKRDIKPWMDKHTPSLTLTMYREIRAIVLADFPGNVWGQTGE